MVWRKSNPLSAQFTHIAEIVRECGLQKLGRVVDSAA
jgi:LysR family hydrogen peroxide-inducible transcriptional activator